MSAADPLTLDAVWRDHLGLDQRRVPELFEAGDRVVDAAHALTIRAALEDLKLTAVFCVQGVPTVGILVIDSYDRAAIADLHGALWNQGLISVLIVISDGVARVFFTRAEAAQGA